MKTSNLKLQHVYPYASIILRENFESRLGDPSTLERASETFMVVAPRYLPEPSQFSTQATFCLNEHASILSLANACKVAHESSEEYLDSLCDLLRSVIGLSGAVKAGKRRQFYLGQIAELYPDLVSSQGDLHFCRDAVSECLSTGKVGMTWDQVGLCLDLEARKISSHW